jgi:beta-glucosidase
VDEALAERLPGASVISEVGCRIDRGLPAIDLRLLAAPGEDQGDVEGETLRVEYFDNTEMAGTPVATGSAHTARVLWIGPPQPELRTGACSVRLSATFVPDVSGAWQLGLESAGRAVLRLDGSVVVDNSDPVRGSSFYGAGSQPVEVTFDLAAGRSYELVVEVWPRSTSSPIMGARIGASPPDTGDEFERAVAAAAGADVAVVVVGSNGSWESEGHDRPDLSLPGRQRELVEAVLEVNRRTVVVVNAGSPVEMPWAAEAGAVLMTWYPGEEGADALADMLVGLAEPSGRLPVTFPARVEDGPAGLGVEGERYPGVEGRVVYGEGVLVGYRFYETTHQAPLFPFGFGLSYGEIVVEEIRADDVGDEVDVDVDVDVGVTLVNNGSRRGTEVVQVYVRAPESLVRRPDRELAGFAKVVLDPGGRTTVRVPLGADAFRYWDDVDTHAWRTDPGRYEVLVGTSSRDISASTVVTRGATPPP